MDILDQLPPEQPGQTLSSGDFAGFTVSLQGASHAAKAPAVPCQDYSALRCLEQERIVLAAIADGVGSCSQSHWGAYTAVCAALDSGERELKRLCGGRPARLGSRENAELKAVLVQAFRDARAAVEQLADQAQQLVFSFQSTLTLAIYDGRDLYYGHVGDDGIVVQTRDGEVEMVTARLKGEEASSVYPLQSGEAMWHFGKSAKPVAAFVMATDGVLDAFVANREDYYGVNYCKGVCYAFMEEAVYTLGKKEPDAPKEALDKYLDYLKSPAYRNAVTDDLTLAAVVSREQLSTGKHPRFSMRIWNTVQEESRAARRRLLNHKAPPDAGPENLFEPLQEEPPHRPVPTPEPEPVPQPDQTPERTPNREDRERPGWYIPVTILLVLLLAGAALIGGIALGRQYFPKIPPEEYSAAAQQRDDLAREAETLTREKEALEETLKELEAELEQSRAECAASAVQTAQLQKEAAELQQQLEALEAQYAETEETLPEE